MTPEVYEPGATGCTAFFASVLRGRSIGAAPPDSPASRHSQDRLDVHAVFRETACEREDQAAAGRGRALQLEAVDRLHHVLLVLGRRLHHIGGAGERDDAQPHVARQLLDERLGGTCAAMMRLGSTSVARMLSETSIAIAIVMYCEGRTTDAVGRAIATIAAAMASATEPAAHGGGVAGHALLRAPAAGWRSGCAERLRRRRIAIVGRHQQRNRSSSQSTSGHKNRIVTSFAPH